MVKPVLLLLIWVTLGGPVTRKVEPAFRLPDRIAGAFKTQENVPTPQPFKVPNEIKLTIKLADTPGKENHASFWESSSALLVTNWSEVVRRTKAGQSTADLGESLLKLSSPKRSLSESANRIVQISVPVTGSLLTRLEKQPQEPQAFLLRSNIRIYDAQLRKNFAFEVNRIWQLKLFPDGEATIEIKVDRDGSFSVWGPIPKILPPGYSIVPLPQAPAKKP
jgi:hypothetical protein